MALMKLAVILEFFARLEWAIIETDLGYDNLYQILVTAVRSPFFDGSTTWP